MQLFPFDLQECKLEFQMPDHLIIDDNNKNLSDIDNKFAARILSDLTLNIKQNKQLVSVVYPSDEWLLYDVNLTFQDYEFKLFKKEGEKWKRTKKTLEIYRSGFVLNLKAARNSGYFVSNLIIPLLVVVVCGLFTIFLPGHSDARLNLAVTVLLGFIFVQSIIASVTPKSDENPLISQYVRWSLILSAFNLAACAVCLGIYQLPENSKPPRGLRWASHNMRPARRAHAHKNVVESGREGRAENEQVQMMHDKEMMLFQKDDLEISVKKHFSAGNPLRNLAF